MKKILFSTLAVASLVAPITSYAANDILNINIEEAMKAMPADVKNKIGDVTFKFGEGSSSGTEVYANKRANGTFRNSTVSCNRAFYSSLIKMANEAKAEGKTEVTNIQSNWENNLTSSTTTYVCADGLLMSGVALKGNIS